MAGFFKNMMKEKKKTPQQLVLDARMKLDEATRKYLNVIDMEARNVRHARKNTKNKTAEAKSMHKKKNAYYGLSIIENTRIRLVDIQTTEELYSAMNDLTEAIQKVNRVNQKSPKPKTNQFVRENEKMGRGIENETDILTNMYDKVESIDDLVSNEVVEKIINGEPVEDFLRLEEGLNVSIDDFIHFNLDEVNDLGENSTPVSENTEDVLDFDFSDFK